MKLSPGFEPSIFPKVKSFDRQCSHQCSRFNMIPVWSLRHQPRLMFTFPRIRRHFSSADILLRSDFPKPQITGPSDSRMPAGSRSANQAPQGDTKEASRQGIEAITTSTIEGGRLRCRGHGRPVGSHWRDRGDEYLKMGQLH